MFLARTKHAGEMKALFDLLFNNMKMVCLKISKEGICVKTKTTINLMFEVNLNASQFDEYIFTFEEPLYVGIESYINKVFKTVKSSCELTLSILNAGSLEIAVRSLDQFVYNIKVAIESVQNVNLSERYSFQSKRRISASRFSDMCKMINPASEFRVCLEKGLLIFSMDTCDVFSESFKFGEETEDELKVNLVRQSDQLYRVSKIVSFSSVLDVFLGETLIILSTGEIGTVKVYF